MSLSDSIYDSLVGEVLCFMDSEIDRSFDEMARRIFAWQFANNAPYEAYCRSLGVTDPQRWPDIPAVPTDAFKIESQPLVTCPVDECIFCFHTSGTTQDKPGKHYMRTGTTYHTSVQRGWLQAELPVLPFFSLTPMTAQIRHSSLNYMFMALQSGNLMHPDGHIMTELLDEVTEPIILMSTALSFLHLMENESQFPKLPEGSWLMETGGYKGTHRSLTKPELYHQLEAYFGVPPERIINEYSMTELSSQFYTTGLGNIHQGPPWTRVRIIHPGTGQEVAEGETGCIVIYDLANIDSVLAIQTQDLAIKHPNHTFQLIGRDPAALPRGCSIAADDFHQN
jgi:hypothetical protein